MYLSNVEAAVGIEPTIWALQARALPLGHAASEGFARFVRISRDDPATLAAVRMPPHQQGECRAERMYQHPAGVNRRDPPADLARNSHLAPRGPSTGC